MLGSRALDRRNDNGENGDGQHSVENPMTGEEDDEFEILAHDFGSSRIRHSSRSSMRQRR